MMNEDSIKMEFVSLCNEQDRLYKPKFEAVFKKLYKLDSTLSKNNPCTTDEALLDGALRLAGFENDEAFCADFKRYNAVFVEGKKLQARLCELLAKSCQGERQVGGWRFVSIGIKIIGSPELVKALDDTMYNDAREGKGLFANVTEIPQEEEAMDEYLCVEAYGLKYSFVSFYDELKQFGIINGEKPFFSKELTNLLFVSLKQTATYIKEHTDKPLTTKNKIARLVKKFDSIPIWGLFLQILFLQGLCRLLECVNLNKGDDGYIEACSLMEWLCERLAKKETDFCCTPYGDKDLDLLTPFCTYLNSTQLGQYVQSILFGNEPHRERTSEAQSLNPEPEQTALEPQREQQTPTRGKGRPKETLKDKMIDDADGQKLQKIHSKLKGKKGKDAALIVLACIKKGWLTKPTYTQVKNEFGDIGSKTGFDRYLQEQRFTKEEIEGAINSLD